MGLNKTDGEFLGDLGRGKPVPIEKWAEVFDMLNVASAAAALNFIKKGAPRPIQFSADNIMVQEHHFFSKIVWIFWMQIKGRDHYDTYTFELGKEAIAELALVGKWPAVYAMPADVRVN
jgi:hypothetical protein